MAARAYNAERKEMSSYSSMPRKKVFQERNEIKPFSDPKKKKILSPKLFSLTEIIKEEGNNPRWKLRDARSNGVVWLTQ